MPGCFLIRPRFTAEDRDGEQDISNRFNGLGYLIAATPPQSIARKRRRAFKLPARPATYRL